MTRRPLADWRDGLPWPGAETHKHARGRLAVVSDPQGATFNIITLSEARANG